jgi:hypothetical protein
MTTGAAATASGSRETNPSDPDSLSLPVSVPITAIVGPPPISTGVISGPVALIGELFGTALGTYCRGMLRLREGEVLTDEVVTGAGGTGGSGWKIGT